MFDELDEYLITINRTTFAYNLGRKYGDNFYARQTKSTKAASTRRRLEASKVINCKSDVQSLQECLNAAASPLPSRRSMSANQTSGTVAAAPQRTIKMNQINQTTPSTYNQMYFEGIQTLELNALTFN